MAESCDDAYLRRIVAGAATIAERLHGAFEPIESAASARLAEARMARWRAKVSGADPSAFDRRLDWLGTSVEQASERLGEVRFTGALPDWAAWFARSLERARAPRAAHAPDCPFASLVAPFVDVARAEIEPAFETCFAPAATHALLEDLAQELSHIVAPALYLEFSALRAGRGDGHGSTLYDAFVGRMLSGGLRDFFLDYPVAARLLATTLADFVANSLALADALAADLPDLAQTFAAGELLGRVVGVRTALSDRHDGGRTVSLLTFAAGVQLVYKPRDITIERAWFDLLENSNQKGGEFGLLRVLAKRGRGWVEVARPADCSDPAEITLYYRRAGMLLALFYAVEAADCFFENIVARGAWPVLIDMETLMHPVVRRPPALSAAETIADDMLFNSVLRAGFLPAWEIGPAGHRVDISGLGAQPGQVTSYVRRVWQDANTDAMTLTQAPIAVESGAHLPTLDGKPARVAEHVAAVVDGFRALYRQILTDRAAWLGPEGLAQSFGNSEIRFVFHATRIYGLVLKRLGVPRHMRSGVERSIELDVISRFYLESPNQDRCRAILDAETAALDRLDVPKFTVRADRRALDLPTGVRLEDFFEETAIERVQRRIGSFGEDDLRLQCDFIRASLDLAGERHRPTPTTGPEPAADLVTPSEMVGEARTDPARLSSALGCE